MALRLHTRTLTQQRSRQRQGVQALRASAATPQSVPADEKTDGKDKPSAKYEVVVGIETHIQLSTETKAFCACRNAFGEAPNTNVCPICLGHPGTLPKLNRSAIEKAIGLSHALNAKVSKASFFARKQYFYPDLPKGYQISQHTTPLMLGGEVRIGREKIAIERAHLEEDAGKSFHNSGRTLVDYNRAGVPLLEVVTAPTINSGELASMYASELRRIVRFLGISDGEMAEGSMRCDVNVSVRPAGSSTLGDKVEVKNLNSFSALSRAIDFEERRQIDLVSQNSSVDAETRTWDEANQETRLLRKKEEVADYRYFPEPDLPAAVITDEDIERVRSSLPELPSELRDRLFSLGLPAQHVNALAEDQDTARYFDEALQLGAPAKAAANWVLGDIMAHVKSSKTPIMSILLTPRHLARIISLIDEGKISGRIAKESILPETLQNGGEVDDIVAREGLEMSSDEGEIGALVDKVLGEHPEEVESYKGGRDKVKGFLVGQVMKRTEGKANPKLVDEIMTRRLKE